MKNQLKIETLRLGSLETNCYLVFDNQTLESIIIDPADDAEFISRKISDLRLKPMQVIATHGHFDHIMAVFELQTAYRIPFCISRKDAFLVDRMNSNAQHFLKQKSDFFNPQIDINLDTRKDILLSNLMFEIIPTPGHTPGSICLYNKDMQALFSGDTLFADGGVGRTDFEYCDKQALLHSISKLMQLPPKTCIYCGHGPISTIANEFKYHE